MEQNGTTTLELELISAKDLKNVSLFTKMDVLPLVLVDEGRGIDNVTQMKATAWVEKCGSNPTFNHTMRFTLDNSLLHNPLSSLQIRLFCLRPLFGYWQIAAFHVPFKKLFDDHKNMKFITSCQVWGVYGRPNGELSFSYKFGDDKSLDAPAMKLQPVTSYPVYPGFKAVLAAKLEEDKKSGIKVEVRLLRAAGAVFVMYALCSSGLCPLLCNCCNW